MAEGKLSRVAAIGSSRRANRHGKNNQHLRFSEIEKKRATAIRPDQAQNSGIFESEISGLNRFRRFQPMTCPEKYLRAVLRQK